MRRLLVAVVGLFVACGVSLDGPQPPPDAGVPTGTGGFAGGSGFGGGAGTSWGGAAGGAGYNAGQPGGLGVVTGGAQDFSLIRAQVDAGVVPKAEDSTPATGPRLGSSPTRPSWC